jgi:hypothetical protein
MQKAPLIASRLWRPSPFFFSSFHCFTHPPGRKNTLQERRMLNKNEVGYDSSESAHTPFIPVQRESKVDFQEVKATFVRDNAETPERNAWPLRALEIANTQFGDWERVLLFPDDLGNIMLPRHDHGVSLVPPSGSSVSEALKKLDRLDRSSECYRRIQTFSDPRTSAVFLSVAPINDPHYPDYKGLVDRGYKGLMHLDGLHRLIAWHLENKRTVPAYIAGL